jgi:acetyl esterase/lipase
MARRTRRVVLVAAVLLAATGGLLAARQALASATVASLYSGLVADRGVAVESGVAYGPLARDRLDIYQPASGDRGGPIAMFIYGGGWRSGDRATYGFVGAALAARGITAVVADYRLYPNAKFPVFVEDAARAYAWVSASLAAGDGKTRPIVLIGHSAGAHIAAMLAFDERYLEAAGVVERPAGLIGLAGPYAFDPTTYPTTAEIFAPAAGRADDARPVAFVRQGAPRTLLMHGLEDETVQLYNTRELAGALRAVGTDVRKIEYAGIGHMGLVLAISRPLRWRAPVLGEMVAFVRAMLERTNPH